MEGWKKRGLGYMPGYPGSKLLEKKVGDLMISVVVWNDLDWDIRVFRGDDVIYHIECPYREDSPVEEAMKQAEEWAKAQG